MRAVFFSNLAAVVVVCLGIATARPAAADESAFIQALANQAIAVLQDKGVSLEEREAKFQRLLSDGFAMRKIGRFVVGRYWKAMTPDQQAEYQNLFAKRVLKSYSIRLGGYKGQNSRSTAPPRPDRTTCMCAPESFRKTMRRCVAIGASGRSAKTTK